MFHTFSENHSRPLEPYQVVGRRQIGAFAEIAEGQHRVRRHGNYARLPHAGLLWADSG